MNLFCAASSAHQLCFCSLNVFLDQVVLMHPFCKARDIKHYEFSSSVLFNLNLIFTTKIIS